MYRFNNKFESSNVLGQAFPSRTQTTGKLVRINVNHDITSDGRNNGNNTSNIGT